MTPYERLMAEAIPTGRFGRSDVDSQARKTPAATSTPEQQAARRAVLEEAQHGWRLPDERSQRNRERTAERKRAARPRHLRVVPDPNDTRAA
ncbi:hypothetical protein [Streptomyces griseomycini]|uniref:Uncharacterized protein n=1 Tax=Streptomyces griseomycini TaxID=66895 RepID=A0A7W7PWJ2_9ACTN|nr:hypothetical protein [Streptomyces griseomycini]MBB4902599.1 hypothetical protein [Streptomyces griseomycini]GGR54386.1 hypothetical protein GCM10015536_69700 [Streptomyces griseomycini]